MCDSELQDLSRRRDILFPTNEWGSTPSGSDAEWHMSSCGLSANTVAQSHERAQLQAGSRADGSWNWQLEAHQKADRGAGRRIQDRQHPRRLALLVVVPAAVQLHKQGTRGSLLMDVVL